VQDSALGAGMTYGGTVALPDYSGDALMLSDIVLVAPDSAGSFQRGPHSMSLVPTQVFPGGRFNVFYEVYNLPPGAAYRTELRIERVRRGVLPGLFGRSDPLALSFDDLAPEEGADPHYQLRTVTAPLAPGEYVLRVRLRSGGGEAERTRRFTVPAA
jgi:hypothetical protein